MVKVIHISDFHLESENLSFDKNKIISALINDLKSVICDKSIIIFSGDLIDKSGIGFKDKELAFDYFKELFIDKIFNEFPTMKNRFFIVPGNHDFDRSEVDEFSDFPRKKYFNDKPEIVEDFVSKNYNIEKHLVGLKSFKEFEKSFYKNNFSDKDWNFTQFENSFRIQIDGINTGLSCLNTTWLSFDDIEKGSLFLSKFQVENSLKFISDCSLKIAVIHHPLEFLNEKDLENVKSTIFQNYDMLLMGHTHKLEGKNIDDIDGKLFLSVGKSITGIKSKESDYKCGYSVIEFYPNEKFKVYYKKYIEDKSVFVNNTDIGNNEGVKEYIILKGEELKSLQSTKSIIDTIKTDYLGKLNDDLILNISQSNKTSLKDVFVEPILCNLPENNIEEEADIEYFETDKIIDSNKNYLIFGGKDTGKTILLDKLLIDYTENFNTLKKIPILIKFKEIGTKNPFQLIREYILKDSEETRQLLLDSEIGFVLLIDDFEDSGENEYFIKELKKLISENTAINIIATQNFTDEELIPIKSIEAFSKIVDSFEPLYIHLLKSKQIKGLINNWVNISDLDVHQNIEKLIKGFNELGLPKTPLAVTLFLWIINKQEKKPINNAVLVEMFVENLLEKGSLKNIYFDTFDFGDKQRLLAYLAKYMLDNGAQSSSYTVNQYDLLKYIEGYLKLKIDINPEKMLDYLISRGLLSNTNCNGIRFKSGFFFSYFLAKYMIYDEEFKNFVFNKSNYLKYINEIDFYTGLNREDSQTFEFIMNELESAFSTINQNIRDNYDKVDMVLETEETVSSKIDLDKAKIKPSESQLEEAYDNHISNIPSKKEIESKEEINESTEASVSKILKLASIVLKNSSDINPEIRKAAYDNVILSSMSFMLIYRDALLLFYHKDKKEVQKYIPKRMSFGFFINVLPIIHQVTMYNWLGSSKLAPIIRQKITEDSQTINISEFEKFLSVYIYSDIRGRNHDSFILNLFKEVKHKYILDASFIKNMTYYHLRSKTTESDNRYTKLLADIKVKLNEVHKSKKGQYIQQLQEGKKSK